MMLLIMHHTQKQRFKCLNLQVSLYMFTAHASQSVLAIFWGRVEALVSVYNDIYFFIMENHDLGIFVGKQI